MCRTPRLKNGVVDVLECPQRRTELGEVGIPCWHFKSAETQLERDKPGKSKLCIGFTSVNGRIFQCSGGTRAAARRTRCSLSAQVFGALANSELQ